MPIANTTDFFIGLEQSIGLPLWIILAISIVSLIFLLAYVILIPLTAISIRNSLSNLSHAIQTARQETKRNYPSKLYKYNWKT